MGERGLDWCKRGNNIKMCAIISQLWVANNSQMYSQVTGSWPKPLSLLSWVCWCLLVFNMYSRVVGKSTKPAAAICCTTARARKFQRSVHHFFLLILVSFFSSFLIYYSTSMCTHFCLANCMNNGKVLEVKEVEKPKWESKVK